MRNPRRGSHALSSESPLRGKALTAVDALLGGGSGEKEARRALYVGDDAGRSPLGTCLRRCLGG
jgi:hypothetical protein